MATFSSNHHEVTSKLHYFLETKKIPNIIFHGESQSGKRTLLNEFLYNIYEGDRQKMNTHIMTVECCHGKGIKFIRDDLKFFAKSHIQSNHGANFKSIVLLNADNLTIDAQSALRRCIELFSHNTRFFIVVENKERLLNPILSRFCELYVVGNDQKWTADLVTDECLTHYRAAVKETSDSGMVPLVHIAVEWCERGFSAYDWLACQRTDPDCAHKDHIAMCFHKVCPDIRCEKMVMFYLLYFQFVCSKSDLENMLL